MGCSLSAAADMKETKHALDTEARNNDELKHCYMLIHSLLKRISDSKTDQKHLENQAAPMLSDQTMHNDTFIIKMERLKKQVQVIKAEQEMFESTLKGYIEKVKSLTKVHGVDRMDIENVAKSGYYDVNK